MRQIVGLFILVLMSSFACAADNMPRLILDKIRFQVSSRHWVNTQTALLSIDINETLNSADLVKARADLMSNLNKIAKGEWHIIVFDRSQDSSGLEKLHVLAEVRVTQAALTNMYKNAKSVSTPGSNYEVSSVDFKPSLEEIQVVRGMVREQLYQQVNDELSRINKAYPAQNYSVSRLVFLEGDGVSQPQKVYEAKEMNALSMAAAPAAAALTVSNELVLTAVVEVASNRKQNA